MLVLRIYIGVLALLFSVLAATSEGFGVLSAVVVTCSLLFLILDLKTDLEEIARLEQQLKRFTSILEGK